MADKPKRRGRPPAFLFDLDGTLVDSVYQHVLAWREELERAGAYRVFEEPAEILKRLEELGVRLIA